MAKELRKSRGEELFAVAVREVFDAVAELRTDQSTEWTEELKESLMEFADIIAEPTDLPPEREFDFEINLESDEPPKERTYRMSPAELQETMMNRVLSPYLGKFCGVYLDDVLIYSKTAEEHLEHIRLVLRELQRHHLHIKLSKCSFGSTSVEFLGHIVEAGQIKMDPRKVEAVQQWPVPKTVKDVRGFLGLAGYYRKFIHNFAAIAAPLHDLTKNQPEFVWTPRADAAFRALKDAMLTAHHHNIIGGTPGTNRTEQWRKTVSTACGKIKGASAPAPTERRPADTSPAPQPLATPAAQIAPQADDEEQLELNYEENDSVMEVDTTQGAAAETPASKGKAATTAKPKEKQPMGRSRSNGATRNRSRSKPRLSSAHGSGREWETDEEAAHPSSSSH
eukprot:jgi/Tetstr1/429508/TSEL_019413.t1